MIMTVALIAGQKERQEILNSERRALQSRVRYIGGAYMYKQIIQSLHSSMCSKCNRLPDMCQTPRLHRYLIFLQAVTDQNLTANRLLKMEQRFHNRGFP